MKQLDFDANQLVTTAMSRGISLCTKFSDIECLDIDIQ